jgi:uncharacterized protein YqgC (DUF456 family)
MSPRIKYGLIAGIIIAVLNLCGATLMGAFNNCLALITVLIASAIVGYLCGKQESAGQAAMSGAIAGGIVGGFSLVSQILGNLLGSVVGAGIVSVAYKNIPTSSSSFLTSMGTGVAVALVINICSGIVLCLAGAGVGALAANLSASQRNPTTGTQ